MIDTADIVAERYKVSREAQDAYALESQRRTATAQQAKRFDDEIVPLPTTKKLVDKNTKAESFEPVTLMSDEGNRPDTTLEGLAALKPVREGKWITAGNASQLSDGASACVVMDGKLGRPASAGPRAPASNTPSTTISAPRSNTCTSISARRPRSMSTA
jgi:acetyl-CoA C-acetyltransferase